MSKRQKKRQDAARLTRRHDLYLVFKEVNNGVNKLAVGVTADSATTGKKKRRDNTKAKAIDVDLRFSRGSNDNAERYQARVDSMEQLFAKIKAGDTVHIFTDDELTRDIVQQPSSSSVPNGVIAKFNQMVEGYEEIKVRDIDPELHDDFVGAADRMVRIKANRLANCNKADGHQDFTIGGHG